MVTGRQLLERAAALFGLELIAKWRLDRLAFARHLARLFAQYDVRTVLDVGANRGQFGDFLRNEVGFTGTLISFEPLSNAFRDLTDKAMKDPSWLTVNAALGETDGTKLINVTLATEFASFLNPNKDGPHYRGNVVTQVESVVIRRLDAVLAELGVPCDNPYLKLDTQGFDLRVIAGAERILADVRALQTEMSVQPIYEEMPSFEQSLAQLRARGFQISAMFPVTEDCHLRLVEFDCVMVNRNFIS